MGPTEYEKCILSVILRFPSDKVCQAIVSELDHIRFGENEHRLIYNSIQHLIFNNLVPNTVNVASELKDNLSKVGGIEYLESLTRFLPGVGIDDQQGVETWVIAVDNAGRLRHLGEVIKKYGRLYQDFSSLVKKTKDVDEFLQNFMEEINKGVTSVHSRYKHISVAGEEELWYFAKEYKGEVSDLIRMGWPCLENYQIPRPSSFGAVVGLPSIGKTQFTILIGVGVAKNQYVNGLDGVVSINSLETKSRRIVRRAACAISGTDTMKLAHAQLSNGEKERYKDAVKYVMKLPIYYDDVPDITTTELTWQAMAQNIEHNRVLGISDFAELFLDKGESEELRVSKISRNLRRLCWKVDSCEILISQFNNSVRSTKSLIGDLSKARYTGALEQVIDWGIILWNPIQMRERNINFSLPDGKDENMAYAIVAKNKEYAVGEVEMDWLPKSGRFMDPLLMGSLYADNEPDDF